MDKSDDCIPSFQLGLLTKHTPFSSRLSTNYVVHGKPMTQAFKNLLFSQHSLFILIQELHKRNGTQKLMNELVIHIIRQTPLCTPSKLKKIYIQQLHCSLTISEKFINFAIHVYLSFNIHIPELIKLTHC